MAQVVAGSTVLPFVVSAISEAEPTAASEAVAQAIAAQPDLNLAVVNAAATAAPAQTKTIVAAAVRQQPSSYSKVALVAAQAAPVRHLEVMQGLSAGLPQLAPLVDRTMAQSSARPDVSVVIAQVNDLVVSAARGELAAVRTPGTAAIYEPVYVPLVAGTQQGPPIITPLTPPVVPPVQIPVAYSTPQSGIGRNLSAP